MKKIQLLFALSIASTATAGWNPLSYDWNSLTYDLNPFADPFAPIKNAEKSTQLFAKNNPDLFNTIMSLCKKLKLKGLPFKNSPYLFNGKLDSVTNEYYKHHMSTSNIGNVTVKQYRMMPKLYFGKKALQDLTPQELEALVAINLAILNLRQGDANVSFKKLVAKVGKYTAATIIFIIMSATITPPAAIVVAILAYYYSVQKYEKNLIKRADLDALKVLGNPANLISALEQEDRWEQSKTGKFKANPKLAERIKYLRGAIAK